MVWENDTSLAYSNAAITIGSGLNIVSPIVEEERGGVFNRPDGRVICAEYDGRTGAACLNSLHKRWSLVRAVVSELGADRSLAPDHPHLNRRHYVVCAIAFMMVNIAPRREFSVSIGNETSENDLLF